MAAFSSNIDITSGGTYAMDVTNGETSAKVATDLNGKFANIQELLQNGLPEVWTGNSLPDSLPNGKLIWWNNRLYYSDGSNKYLLDQDDYNTLNSSINSITTNSKFQAGDIKITTRSSLGSEWALCNGSTLSGSYPALSSVLTSQNMYNGVWETITPKTCAQCGYSAYTDTNTIQRIGNYYVRIHSIEKSSSQVSILLLYSTSLKSAIQNPSVKEFTLTLKAYNNNYTPHAKIYYINNKYIIAVTGDNGLGQGYVNVFYSTSISGTYSLMTYESQSMASLSLLVNGNYCLICVYISGSTLETSLYLGGNGQEAQYTEYPYTSKNTDLSRAIIRSNSSAYFRIDVYREPTVYYFVNLSSSGRLSWESATSFKTFLDSSVADTGEVFFINNKNYALATDGNGYYDLSKSSPTKITKSFSTRINGITTDGSNYYFIGSNYIGVSSSLTNSSVTNHTNSNMGTGYSDTVIDDGVAYGSNKKGWIQDKYILPNISSMSTNTQATRAFIRLTN